MAESSSAAKGFAASRALDASPERKGTCQVTSRRFVRFAVATGGAMLAALLGDAGSRAHAQGRLDGHYNVTLGGVAFGKGTWLVDVRDDQFTSAVSGATSGVLRLFTRGQGSSAVRGTVHAGQLSATSYASSIATDKKYDDVRMVMSAGAVKEYAAEPPTIQIPERVPITEAHRRGIADPLTASLMKVPGNGDTFVPEACPRKVAIFDGRMRYDLQFAFKRLDKVKSEKGYQGAVVVCALYFAPVAGHVPDRPVIKYLTDMRDAEVWLAPIAGTRLMVPYRFSVPTPLGTGIVQATQFLTTANPQAGNGSRTQ
jgi:hypothetical protein